MKLRMLLLALLLVPMLAFTALPNRVAAKPRTGNGTATFQGIAGTVTNLSATYSEATNTTTISGVFTDTATPANVTRFTTQLLGATGSCTILHLELGPLDLNVLGLMVHLDKVVLDITAQSGSGNLLGNLLCAVAHLLDDGPFNTILADLTDLLNQIFRIL